MPQTHDECSSLLPGQASPWGERPLGSNPPPWADTCATSQSPPLAAEFRRRLDAAGPHANFERILKALKSELGYASLSEMT
jgi:hypothetical protein